MNKIFTVAEAIKKGSMKYDRLQKKSGLTEEQIEILYAVASSKSMYNRGNGDAYVRSIKVDSIMNLMNVLKIDCDFKDIENLMITKSTLNILNDFKIYGDGAHLFSSVDIAETDASDYTSLREHFIIVNECGDCQAFKLDDDITYLGYQKYNIDELKKDYPEIKGLLA